MKKFRKVLLLTGVLTGLLCVSAMAAEDSSGICDVTSESGYALTVSDDTVGAEKLTLTSPSPTAGEQYLVLTLSGESATPTEANIVFIDQNDNGTFTIYPKSLTAGTYTVYLYSTSTGIGEVGAFSYYQAYKLGDVDGENGLNSYDASLILQYLVGTYQFVGSGELAADVDGENGINSYDASLILQYLVGTHVIPGWEE